MTIPQWVLEMTMSDWLLFTFALLVLVFVLDYGIFSPWWKHPIGYIVLIYGVSVLALMFLIIWGVVAGARVDEWARTLVGGLLVAGIAGKIIILHVSRYEGRIESRTPKHPHEGVIMADKLIVPEIWYKAQRVARTAIQTLIAALGVWAGLQLIFPQVLAELAKVLPESWVLWLAGAIASVTVVAGVISRIMAIPAVNSWLTKWLNLGSTPKKALESIVYTDADGNEVQVVTEVKPDEKVKAVQEQRDAAPLPLPGETRERYDARISEPPASA